MSQRTEDSALNHLGELMKMESQRIESESQARVQSETDRKRRLAAEQARSAAESERKARDAEAARLEDQRIQRDVETRMERERSERELQLRLEVEQQARLEARTASLAHEEKMARLSMPARRGMSGPTAAFLIGLTAGVIALGGFIAKAQSDTRVEIENLRGHEIAAPTVSHNNDALRAQIAENNRRAAEAQAQTQTVLTSNHSAQSHAAPRPSHASPAVVPPTTTGFEHLEDGPDPVNAGMEGSRGRRGQR